MLGITKEGSGCWLIEKIGNTNLNTIIGKDSGKEE